MIIVLFLLSTIMTEKGGGRFLYWDHELRKFFKFVVYILISVLCIILFLLNKVLNRR